ncbi:MAG TPA: FHA domain-containing protein [Firmicutes bacterium]|jgi:hypothetical protein|nr:FHA domain-containing protein [Bacillota bacterium]
MGVFTINKFLEVINLPRYIKRYFIIKRIENYTQDRRKRVIIFFLNLWMVGIIVLTFGYLLFARLSFMLKVFGALLGVFLIIYGLVKISRFVRKYDQNHNSISKLILKDREGRNTQTWDLRRKTSLVIGKSLEYDVDINLEDADYASLISKEHAILNCVDDSWYVEDIGSTNGSGIKKGGENSKARIEPGKPYKLNSGDIIYIANTQILVK